MTDEIAIRWLENNVIGSTTVKNRSVCALEYKIKYRWHDLRNDPNDLPKCIGRYLVKIECDRGTWCEVDDFTDNKNWINRNFCREEDATEWVVAWKEIEPFKGE